MLLDIVSPAALPLGLVRIQDDRIGLLGLALQHPPVQLFVRPAAQLAVTGARGDLATEQARRYLRQASAAAMAEIEIEFAIPAHMGLGSEAMLGLSIGRALGHLNHLPADDTAELARALNLTPRHALEMYAFDRGGFLLVDSEFPAGPLPPPVRRAEIGHKEDQAWAIVMYLPRTPATLPEALEADRMASLLNSGPHLSPETARVVSEEMWPTIERDDLATFGQALMEVQRLTRDALTAAGTPLALTAEDQAILDIMRDGGAVAWGRSFAGLALFAVIRGAQPSRDLRKRIADHVGFFGGTVMASVTDNRGARMKVNTQTSVSPPPAYGI